MVRNSYFSNITSRFTWNAFGPGPRHLQVAAMYSYFGVSAPRTPIHLHVQACPTSCADPHTGPTYPSPGCDVVKSAVVERMPCACSFPAFDGMYMLEYPDLCQDCQPERHSALPCCSNIECLHTVVQAQSGPRRLRSSSRRGCAC